MHPSDRDDWAPRPELPPTTPYPQSTPPYGRPPAPYPTSAMPYSPGPVAPYSPGQTGYAQPYQVVVTVQQRPTSGYAIASLVLGILGLVSSCCTFGVFSVLAVILGHVGMHDTRGDAKNGRGMAVAGLVLGYVIFGPAVLFSIFAVIGGGIDAITQPTPTTTP